MSLFKIFEKNIPQLVVWPSIICSGIFVYGLIFWSGYLSLTNSKFLPHYQLVGLGKYFKLFHIERFLVSYQNLFIFSFFFIALSLIVGILLAIFLDQKIRLEGLFKLLYLFPMAISFIVAGTMWKWILNPDFGLGKILAPIGISPQSFDLLNNPQKSLYALVLVGVWQSSGLVMAIFLAGLRGLDNNIFKAATMDGASLWQIYWRIALPMLRPSFITAIVLLLQTSLKSFDLVVSLTGGGPGFSSDLPATFMYDYAFSRNQLALGAASSMVILFTALAIIVPYLYSELSTKNKKRWPS